MIKVNVDKLISIIVERGITFTELSNMTGIDKAVISRILNKKTQKSKPKTIFKIINALGIKFEDIKEE